ncbi:CDIF630_02480 family spore surface protein [Sporosalibacterium faouarense]|uniref:CDIF630_02480 family spore surface protein n=1 Tax=Sporosalibacterium faouarense TaxID=516123 RepID=UPI00141D70E8|nr:DUF3787 domain-containing protein [Sporosalibacterium faouarense]MTI49664.1 DUF3787 domain-containing protein [Bacillota bacterium]
MERNKFKDKMNEMPIENHRTSSLANIESLKRVSRVPIPSILEVQNAKEYVEVNQK